MSLAIYEYPEAESLLWAKTKIPDSECAKDLGNQAFSTSSILFDPESRRQRFRSRASRSRACLCPILGHLLVVCLYTAMFIYLRYFTRPSPQDILKSPASYVVRYHQEIFDSRLVNNGSSYYGGPSASVDGAWAEMFENMHVRVSGDDLRSINMTSIALPDEEDTYWGMLGVNHELHCINRLREALYPEYYFPGLTPDERQINLVHSLHCIETLRQASQCRADLSISTNYWSEDTATPVANFDAPHACVDWNAIMGWQRERSFDPKKLGYLRHPTLGLAYPDGKGSKLGVKSS